MQDRLAQHFLPAEATVMGTMLRPFSLWHWRTLAALESPLIEGSLWDDEEEDAVASPTDLALAVRVCALPPNASHRELMRACRPGRWYLLKLWLYLLVADFDAELKVMVEYLQHHCAGPKPLECAGGGKDPVRSHQTIYLHAGLMNLGFGELRAWEISPGLARWHVVAGIEASGDQVSIVSDGMIRNALEAGYSREEMGL